MSLSPGEVQTLVEGAVVLVAQQLRASRRPLPGSTAPTERGTLEWVVLLRPLRKISALLHWSLQGVVSLAVETQEDATQGRVLYGGCALLGGEERGPGHDLF